MQPLYIHIQHDGALLISCTQVLLEGKPAVEQIAVSSAGVAFQTLLHKAFVASLQFHPLAISCN